jgi:hypothetical protein
MLNRGRGVDMKIVKLIDITLLNTTVTQADYGDFTMTDTYAENDYVYVINEDDDLTPVYPVEIYISLVINNYGNYPPDSPLKWTLVGVSNRWEMFDGYVNTQTTDTSDIKVEITSSNTNKVGLFNLQGSDVTLIQILNTELVTDGDCSSDSFTGGVGWTYDGGDDEYNCDGSQAANSKLYQDCDTVSGYKYIVYFTVSNRTAGKIAGMAGGVAGTEVEANGNYAQVITAGADAEDGVIADADFIGTVDDISIMRVVDNETIEIDLDIGEVSTEWYHFFADATYRTDLSWEYSIFANSKMRIEITTKGGTAACGMVAPGKISTIGSTSPDPRIGIVDYSKKDTDVLGRTYLSQGNWAKTNDIQFWINNDALDWSYRKLVDMRGEAAIFDANNDTDYESLIVYGFWKNFEIIIPGQIISKCSIEVEGLI